MSDPTAYKPANDAMTYDDMMEEVEAERQKLLEQCAKRDAEELPEVKRLLIEDPNRIHLRCCPTDPSMPGNIVCRLAAPEQFRRWRDTMWRDKSEPGMVEAKAKAAGLLAEGCRLYPPKERWDAMLLKYPAIGDTVGLACKEAAEASAKNTAKK